MSTAALPIAPEDGLPQPRRLLAIVALSLGTALTVIDGSIVTVALPTIARDLHVDGSAAVLVVTVYQLTLVMTLLPCAALGERIGLKRLYQYGQILFTIATVLCFFAKSLPFLLVLRVMQAVGAGALLSIMSAMIRNIYPQRQLGRGLGVNSVVSTVSAALAPGMGGLILAVAPWPWLFATGAPLAILSLWLGRHALPDIPPISGRYDLGGAMLNMASFGLLFGGIESAVHGDSPIVSAAIVTMGVLFMIWFVRHARAEERPILPVDLLAQPVLALAIAGALLSFMAATLLTLSLPFRLQHNYGFSPGEVAAIITPWPLTMMVMSPLSGLMSDRVHAGLLGATGMVIATAGLILFAFTPAHPSYFDLGWRMSMCGVGFALYFSPNARSIMAATPRERAASVGGLISTTRLTGQTVGATMTAALLAAGLGSGLTPPLLAAGFAVIAGIFSIARLRAGAPPPRPVEAAELPDL